MSVIGETQIIPEATSQLYAELLHVSGTLDSPTSD